MKHVDRIIEQKKQELVNRGTPPAAAAEHANNMVAHKPTSAPASPVTKPFAKPFSKPFGK